MFEHFPLLNGGQTSPAALPGCASRGRTIRAGVCFAPTRGCAFCQPEHVPSQAGQHGGARARSASVGGTNQRKSAADNVPGLRVKRRALLVGGGDMLVAKCHPCRVRILAAVIWSWRFAERPPRGQCVPAAGRATPWCCSRRRKRPRPTARTARPAAACSLRFARTRKLAQASLTQKSRKSLTRRGGNEVHRSAAPRRQLRTQTEAEVDWRTKTSCGAWMPRREVSSAPCRACCCSVGCFRRRCVARATSAGTL